MAYLDQFEQDVFDTSAGEVAITFLGHGTLMFQFAEKVIHIDPFGSVADYASLPPADLVLITHEHFDHLDASALAMVRRSGTAVVLTERCAEVVEGGTVMANGDRQAMMGLTVEAVPAYNVAHKRPNGEPFHPKGAGNGYVIGFGDTGVYVAGDTEDIPEMASLQGIDIAFLPMNLPYTMTPEMVANAARAFRPRVLYPYHYGDTDTARLRKLLEDVSDVEVRVRPMA